MFRLVFYRTLYSQSAASVTMGSIAAVLKEKEHAFVLTKLIKKDHKNGMLLCADYKNYPVVIAKPNFQDYEEFIPLLIQVKRMGIAKRVFLCGPFSTINHQKIMNTYTEIDGILFGYCEKCVAMLANSICMDDNYLWDTTIPGGIWRNPITKVLEGGQITPNTPIQDLPLPIRIIEENEMDMIANLEFTRGCSNNCSFCHMSVLKSFNYPQKADIRDCEQVIQDIRNLVALGKKFIIFNDSLFYRGSQDDNRIIQFCNRLKEENLSIYFMVYLSLRQFPPLHIMNKLAEVGLVRVFLGVENNDPDALDLFHKKISVSFEMVVKDVLNPLHISYHIGYMVFYPGISLYQLQSSIEYLIQIGKIHRIGVILEKVRLLPNTELYNQYISPLNKIDTAYDYQFECSKVAAVYNGLQKMFLNVLGGSYANAEAMCTSYTLMMAYCYRIDPLYANRLAAEIQKHEESIKYYQDILSHYFTRVLKGVMQAQWSEEEISSTKMQHKFIQEYTEAYSKLQISWALIINAIRDIYDPDIYQMIFKGDE